MALVTGFALLTSCLLATATPLTSRAAPQQNSDGSCYSYTVKSGDSCSSIATAYGISTSSLSTYNDKTTWGWAGCSNLYANTNICLSSGTPPMPQSVSNAVCGPTKPGSSAAPGTDLSTLNPCPLNACCNIWGQCGITPDFCTAASGPTGNPGTAPAGQNGCISNCGTGVTNLKSGPAINVAYYESWSMGRPCARMHVDALNTTQYTHYHWAFVNPDSNNFLQINDTYGEWQRFLAMQNIKRIVSIGGWAFSQDPATANIIPQAMRNPKAFALNVIFFLNIYGLDGVDIDWEYPAASDGGWFIFFLYFLRTNMPAGKTISMSIPASYGTLQAYPIANMANYVDYFVYMTYDYHGQWDYGSQGVSGCPGGNCLRSHLNFTETAYSLSMITKAGVTSNKIVVGVASYGRSFGMTNASCTGPTCTFTGPNSTAAIGACTQEAGILANAELNAFKLWGAKSTYDSSMISDWMVVNGNTWVSYLSDSSKATRQQIYRAYSFAGTSDWAVSMQNF